MPPAEELYAHVLELKGEVAALKAENAWLKRQMFGAGKSETLDRLQASLALGEVPVALPEQKLQKISYQRALSAPQKRTVAAALGKACDYLLRYWEALCAHLRYGETRLDNNLVENAIRPSAIGKKNWLFIGHPDAGQRSAIIYSIVVSCQRRGIDPLAYMRDVLTRLPTMTNRDDLDPLTPAHWQPAS